VTDLATLLPNARDAQAFAQLIDVVLSGRALALVGAGVSAGLRYPDWDALLHMMHERVNTNPRSTQRASEFLRSFPDVLWRAEEYRRLLGDEYGPLLSEIFGADKGTTGVTRGIVHLPFRHIFTTNYDSSLERAFRDVRHEDPRCVRWDDEQELRNFLFEFHDPGECGLVYLHGRFDRPESIVLTDSDYVSRYVRSDDATKRLFALFALQRVVFFGYSLEDPDLMAIMREVNVAVGSKEKARHFAFIGVDGTVDREVHRSRLLLKFGINPIFYDSSNNHASLEQLLDILVCDCVPEQVRRRRATPPGSSAAVAEASAASPAAEERVVDPEDPNKGQFGGRSASPFGTLQATVTEAKPGWYDVQLQVLIAPDAPEEVHEVLFYLHPTFRLTESLFIPVSNGVAALDLVAYGAFTVGAELLPSGERLELDLAELPDAPMQFRMS
jgi:hypothetical protein